MLNQVSLIGNIGSKEIRQVNGKKYASLTIACNEKFTDKNGTKQEKINWFKVSVLSQPLAELTEKYINKGDRLFIQGKLQNGEYEKDGIKHYTTEITLGNYDKLIMLTPKKDGTGNDAPPVPSSFNSETGEVIDDGIPF